MLLLLIIIIDGFILQTFKPGDAKQALTITLIHHEGYTQEKAFYVLLKNPMGKAELGEPNLTRITIIDDDGNDLDLCKKHSVMGLQITVGHWTLADQNLLMSDVILAVHTLCLENFSHHFRVMKNKNLPWVNLILCEDNLKVTKQH